MKMPDKIFIPYEYSHDGSLPVGVDKKQLFERDICYIRKDALLEWAEDYVRKTKNPEMWCTMKIVINKLKSM